MLTLNTLSSIVSADIYGVWVDESGTEHTKCLADNYGCALPGYYSTSTFYLPVSCTAPSSDLKYPSDDFLVKMPDLPQVDSATGSVTYPSDMPYILLIRLLLHIRLILTALRCRMCLMMFQLTRRRAKI